MKKTKTKIGLTRGWFMVDSWLTHGWLMVDSWLTHGWLMVDSWLTHGWLTVDSWLTRGWLMVDLDSQVARVSLQLIYTKRDEDPRPFHSGVPPPGHCNKGGKACNKGCNATILRDKLNKYIARITWPNFSFSGVDWCLDVIHIIRLPVLFT